MIPRQYCYLLFTVLCLLALLNATPSSDSPTQSIKSLTLRNSPPPVSTPSTGVTLTTNPTSPSGPTPTHTRNLVILIVLTVTIPVTMGIILACIILHRAHRRSAPHPERDRMMERGASPGRWRGTSTWCCVGGACGGCDMTCVDCGECCAASCAGISC